MTKKIVPWLVIPVCAYLAVAILTFSIRHPSMTDMEMMLNVKSVLLFRRVEYHSKCLGCGTEFVSEDPSEDVTVCPNCPMSEEELDRLIEDLEDAHESNFMNYRTDKESEGMMSQDSTTSKQAFDAGTKAYKDGVKFSENPYDKATDSVRHEQWNTGWICESDLDNIGNG